MMSKHRFRDWDDEDYRPSQKKHGKGHQSKHGRNDFLAFGDAEDEYVAPTPMPPQKTPQKGSQAALRPQEPQPRSAEQKREFQFGPNTREIRGVKIDMDGVVSIEKVDSTYNDKPAYGIKFLFSGKKGLSRIVWFGPNQRGRNVSYEEETRFWGSLRGK